MDVLTDVLSIMNLRSQIQFCLELTAPWGIGLPVSHDVAFFYVVTRGSCYLEVDSLESRVSLVGGDIVMLPHGDAHTLRDHPESSIIKLEDFKNECAGFDPRRSFRYGKGGSLTGMVAGYFMFENNVSQPFLAALPPLIHIHGEHGQVVEWLQTTLKWLASETTSNSPGAAIMVSRLTDMLFIQILRAHISEYAGREGECEAKAGWLRAIADPHLGKAFEMIHEQPDHPWTVAELASQVHMSRTAFSTRFTRLAGMPPLSYVTKWRMLKAGDYLRRGSTTTIAEVAASIGYESEASFSKAFKREMGVAPGAFRRNGKNAAAGESAKTAELR